MAKIKDAIINGTYPVSRSQYITTPAPDKYFLDNLLATLPEFNAARSREARNKWLDKQLQSDHRDEWLDNQMTLNAY